MDGMNYECNAFHMCIIFHELKFGCCLCMCREDWYAFLSLSNKAIGNSFTRHFEPSEYSVSWIQPSRSWSWLVVKLWIEPPMTQPEIAGVHVIHCLGSSQFHIWVLQWYLKLLKWSNMVMQTCFLDSFMVSINGSTITKIYSLFAEGKGCH